MRVIEPKRKNSRPKQTDKTALLVVICFGLLAGSVIYYLSTISKDVDKDSRPTIEQPQIKQTGELKKLKSREFVELYYSIALPNTQQISDEAPITDNSQADKRIKQLAEIRGYRIQRAPVANVLQTVDEDIKLQPKAASGWKQLLKAAKQDGIDLQLLAGWRSAEQAKQLFLQRLGVDNIEIDKIPSGEYDNQINHVLKMTAPPGYSKHHSGYTVDIGCPDDPNVVFDESVCFDWMSQNNFERAKQAGWIPSYPDKAKDQGPEPEPWEYVWIGRQNLIE